MDDHHLNYIKKLERKKEKHWSEGIPPFPSPSPPTPSKFKNICHISFFHFLIHVSISWIVMLKKEN